MKFGIVITLIAAVLTMIPIVATADDDNPYTVHASYIAAVQPGGNCDGWFADVTVRFRWTVFEVDAAFNLALVNEADEVIESVTWTETLTRGDDEWAAKEFHFEDDWTVFAPIGDYTVQLTVDMDAPYEGGIDQESKYSENPLLCLTVPTEVVSWSEMRSLYR